MTMAKRTVKNASVEISLEKYGRMLDRIAKLAEENEKLKEGKHAHWIIIAPQDVKEEPDFACSSCYFISPVRGYTRYCPHCGALMDGEIERGLSRNDKQKWISAYDQLPDDDREVLAVSDGRVLIANYFGGWYRYIEDDCGDMVPTYDIDVSYWMELPEPPESEDHVL